MKVLNKRENDILHKIIILGSVKELLDWMMEGNSWEYSVKEVQKLCLKIGIERYGIQWSRYRKRERGLINKSNNMDTK